MRRVIHLLLMFILGPPVSNAVESAKSLVTITSSASFETHRGHLYLFISDTNRAYSIPWGTTPHIPVHLPHIPSHNSASIALESNRVYTFTLITEDFKIPDAPVLKLSTIVKVERDGKTIYDREVCQVHQIKMQHRKGWIVYTYTVPELLDEPSEATEQRFFPHRKEYSFGGYILNPGPPRKGDIYVCSQCKKAYEKWRTEHPPKN